MNISSNPVDRLLPTGTVTFLFTDIEGSTTLAQNYPDEMNLLLERHNAILRQSIEAHNGYVFQIIGDAFSSAFHTSIDAVVAALEVQRRLQHEVWHPTSIKVRMGIHTGTAQAGERIDLAGGYGGYLTLTRVQRVMSAAHGGQVLLSSASAELARGQLPNDVTMRDMGEHRLKGLVNPEHLWQLVVPDLLSEFPPLQSFNSIPNNLPAQPTALIGREAELDEIMKRLNSKGGRLVTLTGPGGIGKTRIGLQAASGLIDSFKDGIYFVDLAPIRNPESVPAAIAQTLGLRETSDRPLFDELKGLLRAKKMLLLLDNFEQVTAAAPKVVELLQECPYLKLLVTSREALHVRGEYVFPVPPLAMPKFDLKQPSIEQFTQYEAVRLFIERAQAVQPDFMVTNENAPTVAEICWRLEGLPLAIELAVARVRLFSPQALLERLGSRLKLLRGGARDLPVRQQTLRDLAKMLNHPYSMAYALFHSGLLHLWRGEVKLVEDRAQAVLDIAEKHEFQVWRAVAICLHGAALAGMDQAEEGLAQVHRGMHLYQGLKTPPIFWPLLLQIQAGVCGRGGKPEEGLALLNEGMEIARHWSGKSMLPEFLRLKGELLLAITPENATEAGSWFQQALDVAQQLGARMLELRAAISLCRMWRDQGKAEQGRRVLKDAYDRFTEGFTTADLIETKDLLRQN